VLVGLANAHLIEAAPGKAGRWRMHDLVRLYATRLSEEHAQADGREQATDRLLSHYLDMAKAAGAHLQARPGATASEALTGRDGALAWLDAERPSLVAAVSMAAATGRYQAAMRLPLLMAEYFDWRLRFDDKLTTTTVSLESARRLGEGEAQALNNLGTALGAVRRFDEAITAHQRAAAIFRKTGDPYNEGRALDNLGTRLGDVRRFDEAITAHQRAAAIFRKTGDRSGAGGSLTNLGIALWAAGLPEEAVIAHQDAVTIFREIGDPQREGIVLCNLGLALHAVRRFDEAITAYQRAAAIFRETGDRRGEAMAAGNLGNTLEEIGRFKEAMTANQEAVTIFREIGDPHREGIAMENLERVRAAQQA